MSNKVPNMAKRFRGYFPVVVDLETGGFEPRMHALLEIAAIVLEMHDDGTLHIKDRLHFHVEPHPRTKIEKVALEFTGIDPYNPFRMATNERETMQEIFKVLRKEQKANGCQRTVLVGHNAWFDLAFVMAVCKRNQIKRVPFHPFSSFDTATLGGLAYGQTVLARCCAAAGIEFDKSEAHSALYDAEKTAELFCNIVNKWQHLGGWPLADNNQ